MMHPSVSTLTRFHAWALISFLCASALPADAGGSFSTTAVSCMDAVQNPADPVDHQASCTMTLACSSSPCFWEIKLQVEADIEQNSAYVHGQTQEGWGCRGFNSCSASNNYVQWSAGSESYACQGGGVHTKPIILTCRATPIGEESCSGGSARVSALGEACLGDQRLCLDGASDPLDGYVCAYWEHGRICIDDEGTAGSSPPEDALACI